MTPRMTAAVGADVEALCSKCGDVWHVVVAKVGEQIVKVQCKQCGGYHRYKSPHGAPAALKLPATNRPPKVSKPPRPYRASDSYAVSERVEHPNFGQGVVELSEQGKITVFFATGRRVLV